MCRGRPGASLPGSLPPPVQGNRLKIHDFPLAPNPRKVRTYLAEKGIEVEFQLVNLLAGEQKSAAFLAMNPFGNVPVLELDDGTTLTESLAIIEYFEELHPEPPMWGSTPVERARARRLERIADIGVLGRVGRYVHATKSPLPGVPPRPGLAALMREELPLPLRVLDEEVAGRPFLAGDRPTVGDCTLFAAVAFAGFVDLDLLEGFAELSRWHADFGKRPSTGVVFPAPG